MGTVTLWHGDCLELMKDIPDGSVDLVLCDLPYGTTGSKWDSVVDSEKLWVQYRRIISQNGAIVLFGTEPFATCIRHDALDLLKHIDNAPDVDAVIPVRCAQCKHFKRNLENDTYCSRVNGLTDPEKDDFCSYGERKEGAE